MTRSVCPRCRVLLRATAAAPHCGHFGAPATALPLSFMIWRNNYSPDWLVWDTLVVRDGGVTASGGAILQCGRLQTGEKCQIGTSLGSFCASTRRVKAF